MKSDVIKIDNCGSGFDSAVAETKKFARFTNLDSKQSMHLELITEEMLSLAHSVTGEMEASFWIENEKMAFQLHLTTRTVMDKEKRYLLLSSATSRRNEAANTFLGKLRDIFESSMLADVDHSDDIPAEVLADVSTYIVEDTGWDGYERSVLRRISDNIKVNIRRGVVDITVAKSFE